MREDTDDGVRALIAHTRLAFLRNYTSPRGGIRDDGLASSSRR